MENKSPQSKYTKIYISWNFVAHFDFLLICFSSQFVFCVFMNLAKQQLSKYSKRSSKWVESKMGHKITTNMQYFLNCAIKKLNEIFCLLITHIRQHRLLGRQFSIWTIWAFVSSLLLDFVDFICILSKQLHLIIISKPIQIMFWLTV